MIHDAGDGTIGRNVWRITGARLPATLFVIAANERNALTWLRAAATEAETGPVEVTDVGSADRTEVLLWRDETRIDPTTTDTPDPGGA